MRPWQKGILACLVALVALLAIWERYEQFLEQGSRPTRGTQILNEIEKSGVPNISASDIYGRPFDLSAIHDKVLIVNFWASWCKPCLEEFPSMLKLARELKSGVTLVALSHDYDLEDITNFLKAFDAENDSNLVVIWDKDKKFASAFGTQVLPESFIIGKGGVLVRKVTGSENWASPEAIQFFTDLAKGTYPAKAK